MQKTSCTTACTHVTCAPVPELAGSRSRVGKLARDGRIDRLQVGQRQWKAERQVAPVIAEARVSRAVRARQRRLEECGRVRCELRRGRPDVYVHDAAAALI